MKRNSDKEDGGKGGPNLLILEWHHIWMVHKQHINPLPYGAAPQEAQETRQLSAY